jgi:hypothetical protein
MTKQQPEASGADETAAFFDKKAAEVTDELRAARTDREGPSADRPLPESRRSSAVRHDFATSLKGLSAYFRRCQYARCLPEFIGAENERVDAWLALDAREREASWGKASIAATLPRAHGQRTERDGPTPLQRFCEDVGIGAGHCSRMARTYEQVVEYLATGRKKSLPELLADETLSFKHFLVAFNYAVLPVEALLDARMHDWSANELARQIAKR